MTAQEFFNAQLTTDASSVIDKNKAKFSRFELIRFAEAYARQSPDIKQPLIKFLQWFFTDNKYTFIDLTTIESVIDNYINSLPK